MGCIYMLEAPTGKKYVGQAIDFKKRMRQHRNRHKYKDSRQSHLYNAVRKYGWKNFKKTILEDGVDPKDLDERERFWIAKYDTYNNGYNSTRGGDENPMQTERTRAKLRKTLSKPEQKEVKSKMIKGFHADPEWKANWLKSHAAAHRTPECRAKIVANNKKEWQDPDKRQARSDAIKKSLNTPKMLATKEERHKRMMATKAKQREELLAKLPPDEREKRRKLLDRKQRERQARKVRGDVAPGSQ